MKKISQIVTYFNEEKYIAECVESLLKQTYANMEIIMVSDGSTDRGPQIVKSFNDDRIISIENPDNHGQGYCRNQGLDIATGEYVGFFDGDDISYPERLEVLATFLDEHVDIFCVSCDYEAIDEKGDVFDNKHPSVITDSNMIRAMFLFGCPVGCSCALFRRELVEKYSIRQNLEYRASQDYHYWLQCLEFGKFANIDRPLFYYRIYQSHTKSVIKRNQQEYDKWMIEIFGYAWKNRGFLLRDEDVLFIYHYLYKGNILLWWPWDIVKMFCFKCKVLVQTRRLGLIESKEIISIINSRINTLIPYFYPFRLCRQLFIKSNSDDDI